MNNVAPPLAYSTGRDGLLTREPTPAAYYVQRSGLGLRSTPEHHDWQVASLLVQVDCRVEPLSRLASN
jgi:hypothetical protein